MIVEHSLLCIACSFRFGRCDDCCGFTQWILHLAKNPLSIRANERKRQTDLLLKAWEESGNV